MQIVSEFICVNSLTRLSFPLVRFWHNREWVSDTIPTIPITRGLLHNIHELKTGLFCYLSFAYSRKNLNMSKGKFSLIGWSGFLIRMRHGRNIFNLCSVVHNFQTKSKFCFLRVCMCLCKVFLCITFLYSESVPYLHISFLWQIVPSSGNVEFQQLWTDYFRF